MNEFCLVSVVCECYGYLHLGLRGSVLPLGCIEFLLSIRVLQEGFFELFAQVVPLDR